MRRLIYFLLVTFFSSCNNDKIDKIESELTEIKQSLLRIEYLLGNGKKLDNLPAESSQEFKNSYENTYNLPKKYASPNGRCNAITKKGTQCSRTAKSGGYCWQHGG